MQLSVQAPAKINLFLHVTGKREDGYHELFTFFQMVGVYDEVAVAKTAGDIRLHCDLPGVPETENIVYRAAKLLREACNVGDGAVITLRKSIPMAAGLGGGSSDAAAAMVALNRLWGLGLDRDELAALGIRLGSDVPFFFGGPAALGKGRGEILEPFPPLEGWVLLVNPGFAVSTAWVYGNIKKLTSLPDNTKLPSFLKKGLTAGNLCIEEVRGYLHNSLEEVTELNYPEVKEIKNRLLDNGASAALMSGSGPTVFGLFHLEEDARKAAAALQRNDRRIFVAPALTRSPLTL
ncbi:MAG: 4-(cytidine 5'-diphospho)-2-C-methyl-D-erythritol kinase [Nitrospirota bacterium]|nr:4-(cytidine 5'-diphospho)-2-C-methyl-D-erythritol kinase [Nitrospirota bacterium]